MTNAALGLLTPGAGSTCAGGWLDWPATEITNKPDEAVKMKKNILLTMIRKGTDHLSVRWRAERFDWLRP